MLRKFLKFQMELIGTCESDLSKSLIEKLKRDYLERKGIYEHMYGDIIQIEKHIETGSIVLCGCIKAFDIKTCKGIYELLKQMAKIIFPACKETRDILIVKGIKLF